MKHAALFSIIALWAVNGAKAETFNPTGTFTGQMIMTDVKEIGSPITCQGNIGVPFEVTYTVKARKGKVTVNDTRNVARRGEVLPGSRFKAKANVNDGYYKWNYSVTGTKISRTKGTITEIIKMVFANDSLKRGCQYTFYARDLARRK